MTTIETTPMRSLQQRMDALRKANETRSARARLKRDVKARRVLVSALVLDPPEYLETAKVFDLLMAVPMVGRVRAAKTLGEQRISLSKTFGGLSDRQRHELAAVLEGVLV